MPQGLTVALIEGDNVSAGVSIEQNPAGSGQYSRVSLSIDRSDLRNFPNDVSGLNVECTQLLLSKFLFGLAHFFLAGCQFYAALLLGNDVLETCHRSDRSGIPVSSCL